MKTLKLLSIVLMTILSCPFFTSCSSDDDNDDNKSTEIVGKWQQTNSSGTEITVTFNKNKTGNIYYVFYDSNGRQTGSTTENFEYAYDALEHEVVIIGDTQLEGSWNVTITASLLVLEDYSHEYRFTKV